MAPPAVPPVFPTAGVPHQREARSGAPYVYVTVFMMAMTKYIGFPGAVCAKISLERIAVLPVSKDRLDNPGR